MSDQDSAAPPPTSSDTPQHFGIVAVLGAPNAGKSTLVNALVGSKVTIVSPKVQTTRSRITGIAMVGSAQIVLHDTPGIFAAKRKLDTAMVEVAWSGMADAELVVLVVDARRRADLEGDDTARIIEGLTRARRKAILVLNKIDLVPKPTLLALAQAITGEGSPFTDVFMISALHGGGVDDLRKTLAARMPEGRWHYPEDQMADAPLRFMAAEITREKLFFELSQELPYAAFVETEAWEERKDGSVRIAQVIVVEKDSQKKIVVGKGGARVKAIGAAARRDLEQLLERRVHLFLFVKVRAGWGEDPDSYRAFGLDFKS